MNISEHVRARFGFAPLSDEAPQVELLTPDDARGMHMPWLSRFSPATLSMHLAANPDMALWAPQTGEYVVAERWRRREEIASIVEITARRGKAALLNALLNRLRERGYHLAILQDEIWRDQTRLYLDLGFERIETIVFFEKTLKPGEAYPQFPNLQYRLMNLEDIDLMMQLDRTSFPPLWWNSRAEIEQYLFLPGVYAYAAQYEGEMVGYASLTMYQGWAHLDRLAVVERHQGRKFGAAQLVHAIQFMVDRGAHSVALSTQAANVQSHRLYRGFGFRQTSEKMNFYGANLMRNA